MSSALDAFRAQRDAADQVHSRLTEVGALLNGLQRQVSALEQSVAQRGAAMKDERALLERAERVIAEIKTLRELELRRPWPGVWRRWAVATAFALASAAAFGSGYVWASRLDQAELASLRSRVELFDFVAQRVIKMTPSERRQFDALMKPPAGSK